MRTPQQIVNDCNELARTFYSMQGCRVPADFKFYESTHPQEVAMWNMAVAAYDHIEGTEVDDALTEIEDA